MSTNAMIFQPKGGMCMTCRHAKRDCSDLPFHDMPVVERYYLVARVRCTEHVKVAQPC
jgi:hypothetical protein